MKKLLHYSILLCIIAIGSSCNDTVRNVPANFVGKVLTPTGWQGDIHEAGQVDIGRKQDDGTASNLVLLETGTMTIKEQFLGKEESEDHQDHRIRVDDEFLAVDMYVQIEIPTDKKLREAIFSTVTPTPDPTHDRVSIIRIADVYERYAKMNIRGNMREAFVGYRDANDVMKNYKKINGEIFAMVISVTNESHAPFKVIAGKLSNVKEDQTILDSKAKIASAINEALAIDKQGEALRRNPIVVEWKRLEVLEKIGLRPGGGTNFIMMDTKNSSNISIPAGVK